MRSRGRRWRRGFRVIDRPVIRLTSVDLGATAEITELGDVFHFAKGLPGVIEGGLDCVGVGADCDGGFAAGIR